MKKVIQENNFKVLKYKFYVQNKHYYGCGIIIYDIQKNRIINHSSVISLNPSVYEIDLNQFVEKIEKIIYKYKLEKGALYEFSKKLFLKICDEEEQIIASINNGKIEFLKETLFQVLNISHNEDKIKFLYELSGYNINLEDRTKFSGLNEAIDNLYDKKFFIKTKPVLDIEEGIIAEKIKIKKNMQCILCDNRELSKYVMELLYGAKNKIIVGKVINVVKKNKNYLEVTLSITPIIFTKIVLHKLQKVKLL